MTMPATTPQAFLPGMEAETYVHQDASSDEWFSPRWILDMLPPIAFDPCWHPKSNVVADRRNDVRVHGDGLALDWHRACPVAKGWICYVNPPYGNCAAWVAKCAAESERLLVPVVALVPSYAGDMYWHASVWGRASWVGHLRGRVRFDTATGPAPSCASFTSSLVCWGDRDGAVARHILAHAPVSRLPFFVRADVPAFASDNAGVRSP